MSSYDKVSQIVYATPGGRPVHKTTTYRLYFLDTGVEVTYSHDGLREVTLPEIFDLCAHHSEKEVRLAWASVGKERLNVAPLPDDLEETLPPNRRVTAKKASKMLIGD